MIRRLNQPREVLVLCAIAFSVAVGFGIVAPAIPLLAGSFGVGETAAAAVVSCFALTRLGAALGVGRLVEAAGERKVLALGIAIVAVSSALAGAAPNYPLLLLFRSAGGVGSVMFSVSALTLLIRSVPADRRARTSGLFQASFLFGGILGPSVGGLVTEGSPRAPFFVYAGTLAVAGGIGLLALPRHLVAEDLDAAGDGAAPRTSLGQAWRHPSYRAAMATATAQQMVGFGVRNALVPLFVVGAVAEGGLGLENRWTGIGLTVSALVNGACLAPAGRYADRRGRKPLLVAGLLVLALAMVLLATADSLPEFLAAMVVFGPGSAMLSVSPAAIVGDVVQGRAGTAVAAFSMAGDAGTVVMPLAAGFVAEQVSYSAAFGFTAFVATLPLLVVLPAPETKDEARRHDPLAAG